MTSFAFILGTVPLAIATGSGAVARRIMGTVVIGGMLAATCIAVCLIPVTFYVVERLAARAKKAPAVAPLGSAPGPGARVEFARPEPMRKLPDGSNAWLTGPNGSPNGYNFCKCLITRKVYGLTGFFAVFSGMVWQSWG